MADIVANLEEQIAKGPDMLLQGLAGLVNGMGTGTEWTSEQVNKLGELEHQLADRVRQLRKQHSTSK
jgi:hypothetical protein